jgi:branched-chain amino acid transport system permease protein
MSEAALQPAVRPNWLSLRVLRPVVLFVLLAAVPVVAGNADYALNLFERVMLFAIAALGLDLILGFGGLVSFGQAVFMGLGAYATGILASHGLGDALIVIPASLALSALFAYVTGAICLRTRGVYFIMITLAFCQMAFFIASSLAPYGGDDGLTLHARTTLLGLPFIAREINLYYVTFACLLGTYLLCRSIVAARFGRVLRGAKENPARMASLGYDVFRFQLVAYVIAGAIGGLSGFLLANTSNFVSPAYMAWQRSGDLIIIVLFGGIGTLDGSIVGSAAYLLLAEYLSQWSEHWKMIFGPLLVIVVLFAKGGLIGMAARLFGRRK